MTEGRIKYILEKIGFTFKSCIDLGDLKCTELNGVVCGKEYHVLIFFKVVRKGYSHTFTDDQDGEDYAVYNYQSGFFIDHIKVYESKSNGNEKLITDLSIGDDSFYEFQRYNDIDWVCNRLLKMDMSEIRKFREDMSHAEWLKMPHRLQVV